MNHCQISAGFAGCQDYPECSGGPRCIPASSGKPPCDRTNRIGVPQPSGIEGLSGVQFQQGSTGHIYKCRIYHCGGGGAVVHGKGSRLFVRHCDVYRNHQAGLEARNGGQLIASENKVYDNGTDGFLIGPKAGRCLIRSNKVFENHKEGVAVQLSKEEISVDNNDIHHNMGFGVKSEDCHLSISNNKIFENVFWGILCKSKASANIKENVIFSNKCGGIFIGVNYSGQISVQSNVVRDHAGPWLQYPDVNGSFGDRSLFLDPFFYQLPPGEIQWYSFPPALKDNHEYNNIEGLFHPADDITGAKSRCCHCSKKLLMTSFKRCPECCIAVYCGNDCMNKELLRHESLCAVLQRRFSTIVEFASLPSPQRHVNYIRFGPPFKGPRPKTNSRQAFIIKVQTMSLNCHPNQLLSILDQSHTVDCLVQSPEVFSVVMECGVFGHSNKFTAKKAFFWASFAGGGKKRNIFLNHLAPYQVW